MLNRIKAIEDKLAQESDNNIKPLLNRCVSNSSSRREVLIDFITDLYIF